MNLLYCRGNSIGNLGVFPYTNRKRQFSSTQPFTSSKWGNLPPHGKGKVLIARMLKKTGGAGCVFKDAMPAADSAGASGDTVKISGTVTHLKTRDKVLLR